MNRFPIMRPMSNANYDTSMPSLLVFEYLAFGVTGDRQSALGQTNGGRKCCDDRFGGIREKARCLGVCSMVPSEFWELSEVAGNFTVSRNKVVVSSGTSIQSQSIDISWSQR